MRSWKARVWCAGGLLVLAGLVIAQEQGPNRDSAPTTARPRKPDPGAAAPSDQGDLPKIPSKLSKKATGAAGDVATFQSDVDVVSVDVAVLDNKGHFIREIPRSDFRILEDNVPQQIKAMNQGEAPMTVALVVEFNAEFQDFLGFAWYQTLSAAFGFVQGLKPEDYLAVVAYDLRSNILCDFTTDRAKIRSALDLLQVAGFHESTLYDVLTDTADRMSGVEGRKAIVVIASGIDTLSKHTYGQARKLLQQGGVPVYAIGLSDMIYGLGSFSSRPGIDFAEADNGLQTFATETGGVAFFPRYVSEFPSVFQSTQQALRSQYMITYVSSNKAHDGTFRKIKVELINPATNEPLLMKDDKGKPFKYQIVAKAGYKAPRAVE